MSRLISQPRAAESPTVNPTLTVRQPRRHITCTQSFSRKSVARHTSSRTRMQVNSQYQFKDILKCAYRNRTSVCLMCLRLVQSINPGINAIPFSQLEMLGCGLGNPGPLCGAYLNKTVACLNRGITYIGDIGCRSSALFLTPLLSYIRCLIYTMSDLEV